MKRFYGRTQLNKLILPNVTVCGLSFADSIDDRRSKQKKIPKEDVLSGREVPNHSSRPHLPSLSLSLCVKIFPCKRKFKSQMTSNSSY